MYDLALATRDRETLLVGLNNLGLTWWYLGDLVRAATCHREALALQRQMEKTARMALCLNNLGVVYHAQGDLNSAVDCFREAVDIDREFNRRRDEANHLANLGAVFAFHLESHDRAILTCERAMSIARDCDDRATLARCLTTLGRVAAERADYATALSQLREALEIHRQLKTPSGILPCLANLSVVAYETGDYAEARSLAESAIDVAAGTGDVAGLELALENHGLACLRLGEIGPARRSLEKAIGLAERLRTLVGGTRRERMLRFVSLVKPYVALIEEILLPNGEAESAFQYVERLKARTLLERLASRDVVVPADVPPPLAEAYRRLGKRRRELELVLRGDDATLTNRNTAVAWAEWRHLDDEMIKLETEIEAHSAGFMRSSDVRAITVSEVQRSLTSDDTAMIELFMSTEAIYAFVVTRTDGLRAIPIAEWYDRRCRRDGSSMDGCLHDISAIERLRSMVRLHGRHPGAAPSNGVRGDCAPDASRRQEHCIRPSPRLSPVSITRDVRGDRRPP